MSVRDVVTLGATNMEFFGRTFFPRTMRQKSPVKYVEIDAALDDPTARSVNIRAFRGSGKTTKLRLYAAKRIAYSVSRTILYIGASEDHATRSIQWLRNQVERNKFYAGTFGLHKGGKWNDTDLEIFHSIDQRPIWVKGVGITGNVRGINFDDYRPDLILLDDVITDENAATKEQRDKYINLILGAVKESLAPATEEPNAKIVNLQTPIHAEDASSMMWKDDSWRNIFFPCWTEETLDAPIDEQVSSWPERNPSETLRGEKRAAIKRNKLSLFTREMECRLTSAETSAFLPSWIKVRNFRPPPMTTVLSIDPVPPPSDTAVAKGLVHLDFEAQVVSGRLGDDIHILEYKLNRGHDPSWSMATAFELAAKYEVRHIIVETIAYQKVLEWLLKEEMKRRKTYYSIIPSTDKRSKYTRITTTLADIAQKGHLWIGPDMQEFQQMFFDYPVEPDDLLDAAATGIKRLLEMGYGAANVDDVYKQLDMEARGSDTFEFHRGAP